MKLFEVYLSAGAQASQLISPDVLEETGAKVFTEQEAELVGLEGIPPNATGDTRVFIACGISDEQFIASRLEAAAGVARFKLHEV